MVSSSLPYTVVFNSADVPQKNPIHQRTVRDPVTQSIYPGSYVSVKRPLESAQVRDGFTVECWVRLWELKRRAGIVAQCTDFRMDGFALYGSEGGRLCWREGGSVLLEGPQLSPDRWHHIAAVRSTRDITLFVDAEMQARAKAGPIGRFPSTHLRLAALGIVGVTDAFLDADLAMPVIYGAALDPAELRVRYIDRGVNIPPHPRVLATWPFDEKSGERVRDASGAGHEGRIVNVATRRVQPPSSERYLSDEPPVFAGCEEEGGGQALRFARDDLYDCTWNCTHEIRIPRDTPSGVYTARFEFKDDQGYKAYCVPLVVRSARRVRQSSILVICATHTWRAYASTPFANNVGPNDRWDSVGVPNAPPDAPAYSCYRNHAGGQPTYQLGLRVPWPSASPEAINLGEGAHAYGQGLRTELALHKWLRTNGYSFEVASDLDVHSDPSLLREFPVVVIAGHSEYWSEPAYRGVEAFLGSGGALVVLSGNTMCWRVSFDSSRSILECRKVGTHIGGQKGATCQELSHAQDGRQGGLMRYCGLPAWRLIGLDTAGFAARSLEDFGLYHPSVPDHPLFNGPERVFSEAPSSFGFSADRRCRAVGHEWDVRLRTLAAMTAQRPDAPTVPDEPTGIVTLAQGIRDPVSADDHYIDYHFQPTRALNGLSAEMIYWERLQGGRVFNAGSIAFAWALPHDTRLQRLLRNVLHAFLQDDKRSTTL